MRDEWFYKSLGQEWGPLPFEEVAELAANERLAPDDEVRCGTEGDWVPAGSIVGLFPEPEELSDLSELDFTFGQSGDVPQPERAIQIILDDEPPPPAPPVADQWYSHQFGQDLGPMSLDELKAMASGGALSDNDRVRLGLNGDWLPAGAIEDLREALRSAPPVVEPPERPAERAGATNSRGLSAAEGAGTDAAEPPQVVTVDGQTMVQVTVPLPGGGTQIVTVPIQLPAGTEGQAAVSPPNGKAGKRGTREDQQWFWKDDDGEEHGPMGFDDLQRDAAAGKLRPGDDVKRGRKGVWGPASTLPDLLFPSKSLWSSTAGRQEEAPPRPQPMTTESAATSPAAAYSPPGALPSGFSSPAAGAFGGAGAYGRPAAAPAPRARAAAKSKSPRASFNFDFSGLKETLGDQAKPLIAIAALGLVVLLIYVPLPFGGGDQKFFDAYQAILTEFEGLRTRGASESEWTAFTDKVNQQNDQLVKDLEAAGAGSREPIKQQLLWAGRDYLIPMLSSARTKASPDEEKFREHLQNADRMLKGGTLAEISPSEEEGMEQEAMPEGTGE